MRPPKQETMEREKENTGSPKSTWLVTWCGEQCYSFAQFFVGRRCFIPARRATQRRRRRAGTKAFWWSLSVEFRANDRSYIISFMAWHGMARHDVAWRGSIWQWPMEGKVSNTYLQGLGKPNGCFAFFFCRSSPFNRRRCWARGYKRFLWLPTTTTKNTSHASSSSEPIHDFFFFVVIRVYWFVFMFCLAIPSFVVHSRLHFGLLTIRPAVNKNAMKNTK